MKTEQLNEITGRPVIIKRIDPTRLTKQVQECREPGDDVTQKPLETTSDVDFSDYSHPAISALIPAFEADGQFVSMETGKPVTLTPEDRIEQMPVGTALFFQDGTRVVYTRGWYKGLYKFFFAESKCAETTTCPNVHVFGE